ncbi:protein indeterminate-domain 5, chloroplastic-like isoform X2 [Abrus precatorius]|uniref:Protein indeterminate-domain 5, chloroplastic-like isoform X2 n=1 Tax=Abrus precatorius TaxID=3816 RepID=A0A8B8M2T1_ABRPR|nr:protein indeterminate-domain 5, chloroplastic-like isoform X2 [Abrus precatorius]XP_027361494.1 protein indeterminate-domain 5, chloroplastic-like isoform X2 [Abrus precatorius]XP_027361495.1 protein indeterminate-domain 5, chloroplastic-like isoform X2 [Abrus precatorius]
MAAPFSAASLFGIREEDQNQMKQQQHSSTPPSSSTTPAAPPQKKRRNQPGTPNPDAEVIALSPKTLMATNRFICEVCNKGFQREQNLQLHRRGHNLPWKLKQKTTKEPKRKVYLCPEPTCVHHDPSRALGDLTGIKKHYSRKHGEKKWKCDKCSKKYAVQSDWKAHSKTCGTREYRCDCGTLFSRRDSFITHRAFCDALAQESARQPPNLSSAIGNQIYGNSNISLGLSQMGPQIPSIHDQNTQSSDLLRFGAARTGQFDHILPPTLASSFRPSHHHTMQTPSFFMPEPNQNQNYQHDHHQPQQGLVSNKSFQGLIQLSDLNNNINNSPSGSNLFNHPFLSNRASNNNNIVEDQHFNNEGSNFFPESTILGITDHQTSSTTVPSLFSTSLQNSTNNNVSHMSATALLQKAAQMGAASSSSSNNNNPASSLLRNLGSKSDHRPLSTSANYSSIFNNLQDMMNIPGFEVAYDHGMNTREPKLQGVGVNVGGSDRLTRDFLGVGGQNQMVRSMSGGSGGASQQRGFNLSCSEAETNNAAPSGQAFGGGANFQ